MEILYSLPVLFMASLPCRGSNVNIFDKHHKILRPLYFKSTPGLFKCLGVLYFIHKTWIWLWCSELMKMQGMVVCTCNSALGRCSLASLSCLTGELRANVVNGNGSIPEKTGSVALASTSSLSPSPSVSPLSRPPYPAPPSQKYLKLLIFKCCKPIMYE